MPPGVSMRWAVIQPAVIGEQGGRWHHRCRRLTHPAKGGLGLARKPLTLCCRAPRRRQQSVSMAPGASTLTAMPLGPSSLARYWVSTSTPLHGGRRRHNPAWRKRVRPVEEVEDATACLPGGQERPAVRRSP